MENKLSRRQVLTGFALTGASAAMALKFPAPASAQRAGAILHATAINSVSVAVTDLQRAAQFYQHMFGVSAPRTLEGQEYALDFNGRFVRLSVQPKGGVITQFCVGVDGFKPERDGKAVKAAGIEIVGSTGDYVDVRDPDGMVVRIADTKYNAGCSKCPAAPAGAMASGASLFGARTLNHVNFRVTNLQISAKFYQKLFGLPTALRPILPPGSKLYALDFNESYLSIGEATAREKPAVVTHFCFGIDDFNLQRDGDTLRNSGMKVRGLVGPNGGPGDTVYVDDPDGLNVQIADEKWKSSCPTCEPGPVIS
jgi:catechol 2,3-dioxygenase-like lactoylglutathione lyase family enzyme